MRTLTMLFAVLMLWSFTAQAADIAGVWGSKLGTIRIKNKTGGSVVGTMVKASKLCPYKKGETFLEGIVMEDSFTGKVKLCQLDEDCGGPVWAYAVLLIGENDKVLSGAVHAKEAMCPLVGTSGGKGLYLKKKRRAKIIRKKRPKKPKQKAVEYDEEVLPGPDAPEGTYDPRAAAAKKEKSSPVLKALREGEGWIRAGQFEKARKSFKKALQIDKTNPIALTGIGATYYARNDYKNALRWYKKALSSDPNFGMAYYNIACVYAIQKNTAMALKYLKISLMNGFVVQATMQKDPDLKSLHGNPDFEKMLSSEW